MIFQYFKAWLRAEDGATAIEYGLICAGIGLAIVAAMFAFGDQMIAVFETMDESLGDVRVRADEGRQ